MFRQIYNIDIDLFLLELEYPPRYLYFEIWIFYYKLLKCRVHNQIAYWIYFIIYSQLKKKKTIKINVVRSLLKKYNVYTMFVTYIDMRVCVRAGCSVGICAILVPSSIDPIGNSRPRFRSQLTNYNFLINII